MKWWRRDVSGKPSPSYWFKDGQMVALCTSCRVAPGLHECRDAEGRPYCEECHEAIKAKWESDSEANQN